MCVFTCLHRICSRYHQCFSTVLLHAFPKRIDADPDVLQSTMCLSVSSEMLTSAWLQDASRLRKSTKKHAKQTVNNNIHSFRCLKATLANVYIDVEKPGFPSEHYINGGVSASLSLPIFILGFIKSIDIPYSTVNHLISNHRSLH